MTGQSGFVDEDVLKRVPKWRNYLAAKLGFRNHWYPIKFSKEIEEGQVLKVLLCGENILLKRVDGKVHGMKDRCIHRGVALSEKIECYSKNTITCWYHGFTFKWDSGELCDILADPTSKAIGKRKIKTYPVEEAKGLVFVFIGDEDFVPPPLKEDVPPFFLDDDMAIQGHAYEIDSNWRVAAENGFDGLHVYIHRQSPLIINTKRSLPLGHTTAGDSLETIANDGAPKGVFDDISHHNAFYEGRVEGEVVVTGTKNPDGGPRRTTAGSIWLPGVLRIDNFPDGGLTQFEWYVPLTEDKHLYIITIGKRVNSEEEEAEFSHAFMHRWEPESLEGFNGQDVMAREASQKFYGDDRGWLEEGLIEGDLPILRWRELCHQQNRGIQLPEHLW